MSAPSAVAVPLYYRDHGSGPPIVFLHGIGADHTVWNSLVPRLAPDFRLLLLDLRGHGASKAPAVAGYGFDDLSADVLSLLDSERIDSVHLAGLSAGALLALRLGLDAPERVRSIILAGGAVYSDAHMRAVGERWAETYRDDGPDALAIRLLKDLYYPDWIEAHMEVADRLRAEVPRRDYTAATRWAQAVASFDERARVASLRPPALILQGMEDQVVDAAHGRILRQSIPGSKIRIFPETGHMIPVERAEEMAEAIRGFVREVEARRTP